MARACLAATAILLLTGAVAGAADAKLPHPIRILVLNDRSGAFATATGEGSEAAARMAVEEFGGNILGQPIEIVVGDHANKADLGALVARKALDEQNVDVIADVANSGVGLAVVALATDRKRIVLNNSAAVGIGSCAGTMVELVKQAHEFQIESKQELVAACAVDMSQIDGLGLLVAQGLTGVSAFEWQRSPESVKWTRAFVKRTGRFPTADQAATYSEVRHYLRSVEAAQSLDADVVMAKMRELPVNDAYADNGHLREDGQLVHDLYLVKVKTPEESKEPGDVVKILAVLPGDKIFPPLSESICTLVRK